MNHVHRLTPTWVLLTAPAWADGYHRIVAHAVCLVCGEDTYVSAWQIPQAPQRPAGEEDDALTLQDLIDLLLDETRAQTPREVAITRAVLLAYELGLAQGRHEAHGERAQVLNVD